jgi:hypothetical protein
LLRLPAAGKWLDQPKEQGEFPHLLAFRAAVEIGAGIQNNEVGAPGLDTLLVLRCLFHNDALLRQLISLKFLPPARRMHKSIFTYPLRRTSESLDKIKRWAEAHV